MSKTEINGWKVEDEYPKGKRVLVEVRGPRGPEVVSALSLGRLTKDEKSLVVLFYQAVSPNIVGRNEDGTFNVPIPLSHLLTMVGEAHLDDVSLPGQEAA